MRTDWLQKSFDKGFATGAKVCVANLAYEENESAMAFGRHTSQLLRAHTDSECAAVVRQVGYRLFELWYL